MNNVNTKNPREIFKSSKDKRKISDVISDF